MSELTPLPMSDPGPHTGKEFHDHQRMGLSKLLFMENDYASLYESMVRQDDSLQHRKYLDLSAFGHMWKDEGDHTWSNEFTQLVGKENMRPLQGKGMILADEMGTGKSLIILGLIEATITAAHEWKNGHQADPEEPTYRLPKNHSVKEIFIDAPPQDNPIDTREKSRYWNNGSLGSPPSAIKSSSTLKKSAATLIVCPLSVVGVWQELIQKHWNGLHAELRGGNFHLLPLHKRPLLVHDHYANQTFAIYDALCNASVILTSYDALRGDQGQKKKGVLHKMIFYRVILDEGHHIRNTKTKVFDAVEKLHKRHVHVVSGTPIQNHINDLYGYARLFNLPCGFSDSSLFKQVVVLPAMDKIPSTISLRAWGKLFALRRLKKDLIQADLPTREIKVFWVNRKMLPEPEHLQGVEEKYTTPWSEGKVSSQEKTKKAAWISEANSRVEKGYFVTSHEKIVVFHFFHASRKQAELALKRAGYDILYLQSENTKDGRIEVTGEFNNSKKSKLCLLSSIMVGGEGLSMTGGTACVFLDLWWNPYVHEQAKSRVHRMGQTNPVTIYVPVTKDSYEDGIWMKQDAKRSFTQRLFPNDPCGKLDPAEMPNDLLEWLIADKDPKADENAPPEEDDLKEE